MLLNWKEAEQATGCYEEARKLFTEEDNTIGIADSFFYFAKAMTQWGFKDEALELYNNASKIYYEEQSATGWLVTMNEMIGILLDLGNFELASQFLQEIKETVQKTGNNRQQFLTYILQGIFADMQGNYTQALNEYQKVIDHVGNSAVAGYAVLNRGMVYFKINQPEKAVEEFKRAIDLFKKWKDWHHLSPAYRVLGIAYSSVGKPQQAIEFFKEGIRIDEKTGDNKERGEKLLELGYTTFMMNYLPGYPLSISKDKYQESMAYYRQAMTAFEQFGMKTGNIGKAKVLQYQGVCQLAAGKPQADMQSYVEALNLFHDTNMKREEATCNFQIGLLYHGSKNLKERALEYYEQALDYYDSERLLDINAGNEKFK